MLWLALSADKFEPIPDIQFSLKKPLFAASVVLGFKRDGGHASLHARVPIKGDMRYSIEVSGPGRGFFAFSTIDERDDVKGDGRIFEARKSSYVLKSDSGEVEVDVINDSPAQLLAHIQAYPAFQQTHSTDEKLYGGYIVLGKRIEALRIERVSAAADALARTKYQFFEETYEVRTMRVSRMLSEPEWAALPWASRTAFGFNYDVEQRTLTAARFHVPIIGKIEIKA